MSSPEYKRLCVLNPECPELKAYFATKTTVMLQKVVDSYKLRYSFVGAFDVYHNGTKLSTGRSIADCGIGDGYMDDEQLDLVLVRNHTT